MPFDVTGEFPMTDTAVTDNGYLENCRMVLPERFRSQEDIQQEIARPSLDARVITPHGARHSQGGQSLFEGAIALDMQRLQEVTIDNATGTATVGAGATWGTLHQALYEHKDVRWAPMTHQSSPWFSVGGSLAVNCHGRDPRQGPVAESVQALTLLMPDGETLTILRNTKDPHEADLFRVVLGGYGACAVIQSATLKLKPEVHVVQESNMWSISDYHIDLQKWITPTYQNDLCHHYAMLSSGDKNSLFLNAFVVNGREAGAPDSKKLLDNDGLLTDDMMSILYRAYRDKPLAERGKEWKHLMGLLAQFNTPTRMLNIMRAPIRFSEIRPYSVSGREQVDLMQEYFVPVNKFSEFVMAARDILLAAQDEDILQVLTSTARVVQQDDTSLMAYARTGPRVSVVINFKTWRDLARRFDEDESPLTKVLQRLIEAAQGAGGSYYLCYGRFASKDQFKQIYNGDYFSKVSLEEEPAIQIFQRVRKHYDPNYRFNNHFLNKYLA